MYVCGWPYDLRPTVSCVLKSLTYVRVRLAQRCAAVGNSCAELICTSMASLTVCGRGLFVCRAHLYVCG